MKWLLDSLLSAANIQLYMEALNVFALGTGGRGQGLIPDFVLYDNSGARLADVKCISVCPTRYGPRKFNDKNRCQAVMRRACLVPNDYDEKQSTQKGNTTGSRAAT